MGMKRIAVRGLVMLGTLAGMADECHAAFVATFEGAPRAGFTSYAEAGAIFTSEPIGQNVIAGTSPNGTIGIFSSAPSISTFFKVRAEIAGGLAASFVAVDLGDFAADADLLTLEGYSMSGALLARTTRLLDAGVTGMLTLSISAPGIAYAIFGSEGPAPSGSSVYADNFTYEPTASIPEPSSLTLCGIASLAGLTIRARRRRPVA